MKENDRRIRRGARWAMILLLAAVGELHAVAPSQLTYQGRLKESGLPVTGPRSVDIQLCDALVAGSCFSTGAQGVQVVNGLFRTTFTVPSGVSLQAGAWYAEVRVGASIFAPREMLASNPYSIYASSAATLIPNPGASYVQIAAPVSVTAQDASGYSLVLSSGLSMPAGTVTAAYFSGNGAGITGITATNIPAANVLSGTLNPGVLITAGSITNAPFNSAVLPSTVAYRSIVNNFTANQNFTSAGGISVTYAISAGSATIVGGLTASSATFTASGPAQYSLQRRRASASAARAA